MIKNRRTNIIIIVLVYILVFSLIFAISSKVENLNGSLGYDKMVIRLKSKNIEEGLNESRINHIKEAIKDEIFAYYTSYNVNIKSEFNNEDILLYGIGGDFKEFYNIDINGSFLTEQAQDYAENVIVLDNKAANRLFGSENIQGLTVEINQKTFKIIGVVSIKKSIVDKTIDNDKFAFIPLSTMENLNPNNSLNQSQIPITNLEISMKNTDFYVMESIIKDFGIHEDNFIIENFKFKGLKVEQRKRILVFLISFIFIYRLIKELFLSIDMLRNKIKALLEKDYFVHIITKKWRIYVLDVLKIILIVIIIIFIWKVSTFKLYIDPDKIPNDPTSLTQIKNTFIYNMKKYISNKDNIYVFSSYRKSNYLIYFTKVCLVIGFICSALLFKFIREDNKSKE